MHYTPQYDETDCGPACLAMIASHFGMKKSITSIRTIAGTDKQGTNLAGMVEVAKKMGFTVKALKGTVEALSSDMPFPFIAHVAQPTEHGTLLHFVIVTKIKKNTISIWDPDPTKKKIKMTQDDFAKIWTGYVIFLNLFAFRGDLNLIILKHL